MKSVCWFRNDLRVLDNPAFYHCCQNSKEVIAIFFVNRKQWLEHNDAKVKIDFWIRNLDSLQQKLNELNMQQNTPIDVKPINKDKIPASIES